MAGWLQLALAQTADTVEADKRCGYPTFGLDEGTTTCCVWLSMHDDTAFPFLSSCKTKIEVESIKRLYKMFWYFKLKHDHT